MDFKLIAPREIGVTGLIQVLLNRGFKKEDIWGYLNTSDNDIIDPATIMNMKEGAKMLIKHIHNQTPTYMQVDSDCDGFTSSAILLNYLNYYFPYYTQKCITYGFHSGKQHGIDIDQMPENTGFVFLADASSEEYEKHAQLKNKGIDVLIIDHHNAERVSENACIINNQLCDYPTKSLSGAGMAFKFCSYLDQLIGDTKAADFLDLAALGCIADVMSLKDFEMRQIVNKGITNIKNPFLSAMIEKNAYSIGDKVTPIGVSFYVAPTVNAVTRIGTQKDKEILFESMLDFKANSLIPSTKRGRKGQQETIVEQAVRNSGNVKKHQDEFRDAFTEKMIQKIEDEDLLKNKILVIQIEKPDENSKNITGLIANKLMSIYKRPVLLLSKNIDKDGSIHWRGSGRNVTKGPIESLQQFLKDTGLVEMANGHDNALGVGIADECMEEFINVSNKLLKDAVFEITHQVDLEYEATNIDKNDILSIAEANHLWGQEVEEPLIAIKNLKVTKQNTSMMQSKTRKNYYTLKIQVDEELTIIKFGFKPEDYEALIPVLDSGATTINLVGRCSKNTGWDNSPQIFLEDFEIVKKIDYYF